MKDDSGDYRNTFGNLVYVVLDNVTRLTAATTHLANSTRDCATLRYSPAEDKLILEEADCWDEAFASICEQYPNQPLNCSRYCQISFVFSWW